MRKTTMRRVRKGQAGGPEIGFLVTWDVDSADRTTASRVYRFVYGDATRVDGRAYRYPGFVEKDGVRYLGQSVLFVQPPLLGEIDAFLNALRVDHEVTPARIG
ncbi:MAG: hypothetical protein AABX97_05955 [Candidatus Thermoplasmatota archaeon]